MPEILEVDDLLFEVRRSTKRKTIGIAVDRSGQLVISAPTQVPEDKLRSAIQSKKQWIYTKLINKEKHLVHEPPQKEYVSGEGFYYLGKSYRLRIVEPDPARARTPKFRFYRGQFLLRSDQRYKGRQHFIDWYTKKCYTWLDERLPSYVNRLGVSPLPLNVEDLGYRWGSCSPSQINFHWRTIMLPVHIIEYVVIHELAHIIQSDHSQAFWDILERTLPDSRESKAWLAEHGVMYGL